MGHVKLNQDEKRSLHVPPGGQVVAWTLAIVVLIPPLARLLLGSRKLAVPLVSAGLLAGGLAATVAGPLLWSDGNQVGQAPFQVNVPARLRL
jgi:hypothetical protein